jgi:transposase
VARPIRPDALWAVIEPVLPADTPGPKGGRPPITHRQALTGILFALKTGRPWEDLPAEVGCGSGMACWRRRATRQADGTWQRLHAVLLERLHDAGKLGWRPAIDASSVRAVFAGPRPARTPRTVARRAASTT